MRIYLDACVLNRLADDRQQERVRREAEAVEEVFRLVALGIATWVSSVVLQKEVRANPSLQKRSDALWLLSYATVPSQPPEHVILRAESLAAAGYGAADAFHLACAEWERVDLLLTTDDRFLNMGRRSTGSPQVRILNPVEWISEVRHGAIRSR